MRRVLKLNSDGSFHIDEKYFSFRAGNRMWSSEWERAFGPPRGRTDPWTQAHYDIAAACQQVIEDVFLLNARLLQERTGMTKLCLAGGVTLNCVANAKILKATKFDDIFVQPAAGDAGGSVGAALYVYHALHGRGPRQKFEHAYLGPEFSNDEIRAALDQSGLSVREVDEQTLCCDIAKAIFENKTIGWFQGRMEFGPRALGNRSIIGNATFAGMKDILNLRIKKREPFRPFAPIVLEEKVSTYFDLNIKSPYMLLAPLVLENMRTKVPSITHVDGTARVQTCDHTSNPRLRRLICEFEKLSGVPIIINTSFNRKGEPVVCTPAHAIDCFLNTEMDILAIGPFIADKRNGSQT
jgi:carbamoyltransferase